MSSNPTWKGCVCQSCGLPFETTAELGTQATGQPCVDYCIFCYRNGAFAEPTIAREEIIERVADHLMKTEHYTHLQARDVAEKFVAGLKRWAGMAASA